MKVRYFVSMISLVCLAALGACKGSEPVEAKQPPLQTQTQPKAEPSVPAPPAELLVTGELQEIDPDAMTLVLKDVRGNELKFAFSPTTKVTGIAAAELSRQEGRNAEIRYVERGNLKSAVLIHIVMGS